VAAAQKARVILVGKSGRRFERVGRWIRRVVDLLESEMLIADSLIMHCMRLGDVGRALELRSKGRA
jgi:hypothetical protein